MNNLYLNTSNGILGVAASITEQTPLPVYYVCFFACCNRVLQV
ncbi:hypothetical protein PL373_03145 [Tenacibaculum maritimum]|nr:hypothetical protein [Tenacibaculum maritimum]